VGRERERERESSLLAKAVKHAMQYHQLLPKAYKRFQGLLESQIYHVLREKQERKTIVEMKHCKRIGINYV